MFDLVIRNGTVFDGSGQPRRIADVAVQDGRIAAVGPRLGKGRREIDAAGLVTKQTRGPAEAYGLNDRGLLAPGHKADINVIDFDALTLKRPEVVHDLPGAAAA